MNRIHVALLAALLSVVLLVATASAVWLLGLFVSMGIAGWEVGKLYLPTEA